MKEEFKECRSEIQFQTLYNLFFVVDVIDPTTIPATPTIVAAEAGASKGAVHGSSPARGKSTRVQHASNPHLKLGLSHIGAVGGEDKFGEAGRVTGPLTPET